MQQLTYKRIFKFWIPLAATWLMMSVEGPFLAALIARMKEPEFNLAAYGVAFSFALIIEAPIIMIMSASTALSRNYFSFIRLRNFTYTLNLAITVIMLIFLYRPFFDYIAISLINLPIKVASLTHTATLLLLPWPASIGYRRFYQGLMIRHNMTRRVAFGTIIRLSTMAITALILYIFGNVHGVIIGASALSAGVISEAVASKFMTVRIIKEMKASHDIKEETISYSEIITFYYPLALTSILSLAIQPMVTFFMGQARMSLASLAVLPVVNSFLFIFKSFGFSYQEAGIALRKEGYTPLRNFAIGLAAILVLIITLVALTPLSDLWFSDVSGLSSDLSFFAGDVLKILIIFPALEVLINFQRAILVDTRNTRPITFATIAEVAGIVVVLFICVKIFDTAGAIAAAIAYVAGRLLANMYLLPPFMKSAGNNKEKPPRFN